MKLSIFLGGNVLNKKECKLLGRILKKTGVNLSVHGIDVEQLAKGEVEVTYEEMEYVLKDNPTIHVLAVNLKEELTTSELMVCNILITTGVVI